MYGNVRTPFASVATADPHPHPPRQVAATAAVTAATGSGAVLGHGYYPNYHLYNVPSSGHSHGHPHTHGHGHVLVGPALAQRYAHHGINDGPHDYTPIETEELLRRRGSSERRGSGSGRRHSGSQGHETTGAPGKKSQRFEILRKLGSGTYGRVSLAMDHKAGEEVAVKVIRKSAIENAADLIRIRREIRIMSALKHPNIIEIKEVFENDEKIILVMEYASGGELYDYVGKHGPLGEDEVRRLFRQIVSAVFYCHKHGVAHRDLKLENILLDSDMGAKIADFGLSNYFTEYSLLRTFCGSPLYASPEIINGTPYKGPEVDCWSLGVLLYTLAYSSMPFDGRDFNRMARQIKRGAYYEPDPPSSASMLIRSMLRVNPERRTTIVEIAAHWWLNFDENGIAIADMPENQVIDSTPLYIRQETMMIQSFGEENEMFAEFTHLSDTTRKKIEEFRRRRREAEWYLTECQTPLKKQSKKRSSSIVNDQQKRQSSQAMAAQKQSREPSVAASGVEVAAKKSMNDSIAEVIKPKPQPPPPQPTFPEPEKQEKQDMKDKKEKKVYTAAEIAAGEAGGLPDEQLLDNLSDPLNRLKALETRLNKQYQKEKAGMTRVGNLDMHLPDGVTHAKLAEETGAQRPTSLPFSERPPPVPTSAASTPKKLRSGSMKMSVDDLVQEKRSLDKAVDNATAASLVSAVQEDGNRMVNRLLEEVMKGTVTQELIDSIKASEAYRTETFVREILESVLAAQSTKPVTTPSTPTARTPKLRSKQSSLTRIPTSGSSSSSGAPDIVRQDSEKSAPVPTAVAPLPDVVTAVTEPIPPAIPPQTPPVAPVPSVPMKLIYETVPEDAELQLEPAVDGEPAGEPPSMTSSTEQEEDVCSTDFEDLEIDEDEDGNKSRRGEDSPLSATGSFASTHSNVGELPEIRTFAPAEPEAQPAAAENAESEDNPFLRGLSKRLSRGKYERSKYVLGRGISIEESPRSSRRRLAAEKRAAAKQLGNGSLEENESEHGHNEDAMDEQSGDGAKSPRRRHSEGDKNHLDPMARSGEWLQKTDSDLGSSEEASSPPPNPDTRFHYEELEKKAAEEKNEEKANVVTEKRRSSKDIPTPAATAAAPNQSPAPITSPPPTPAAPTEPAELSDDAIAELLMESQRRREERAKLKKGLRTDDAIAGAIRPTTPPKPDAPKEIPVANEKPSAAEAVSVDKVPKAAVKKLQDPTKEPEVPSEQPSQPARIGRFSKHESIDIAPLNFGFDQSASAKLSVAKSRPKRPAPAEPPPKIPEPEKPAPVEASLPISEAAKPPTDALPEKPSELKAESPETPPEAPALTEPAKEKKSKDGKKIKRRAAPPPPVPQPEDVAQDGHVGSATAPDIQNATAIAPQSDVSSTEAPVTQNGASYIQIGDESDTPRGDTVPNDPSGTALTAGQRRSSYRKFTEDNQSKSQEEKYTLPKSPTSTDQNGGSSISGGPPRSSKYHQTPSGVVTANAAAQEPYWLQYAKQETQKLQTQPFHAYSSGDHHGYTAGDYKSSVGHGYERTEDDYVVPKSSHVPPASSYRIGSSYATREQSPPRTGFGPSFRTHGDPPDTYSSTYQSSLGGTPTGRSRKSRALYHQKSSDELGDRHDDSLTTSTSKRFSVPSSAAVTGYAPSYSRRTTGTGDYFKSLYDDNVVYRRSHYDVQPEPEDDWKPNSEKESSGGHQFRVFQPKGLMKRRSRSLDKSQARRLEGTDDQPEPTPTHINYHDTSGYHYQPGSGASRYEPRPSADSNSSPLKSILKKQPTFDSTNSGTAFNRYGESERKNSDGDGRPMNFIGRLRRHLSNEKSPEPPDFISTTSNLRTKNDSALFTGSSDTSTHDYGSSGTYDSVDGKPGKSKRNLMHAGRRRTAEIRYGGADPPDDYHYSTVSNSKRATSPIDKIKGFFSGGTTKGQTTGGGTLGDKNYHYTSTTSPYSSAYQSNPTSTTNPSRDRETNSNYSSGYRKPYQSGGGYRPTSYGGPSGRYNWYDDSSSLY